MTTKVLIDLEHSDFSSKTGFRIRHETPINPLLDLAAHMRAKEEHLRKVKNNELQPMAVLGEVEIMQIKAKYGIDVLQLRGNDHKALAHILETDYPKLKTTNKKIHRRVGGPATKFYGAA